MCDNCDAHCCCSVFVMNIRLILIAPKVVIVALVIVVQNNFNDGILIGARHETLQISILYKQKIQSFHSVRTFAQKDYFLHRYLRRQIFQQNIPGFRKTMDSWEYEG